jgi:hypothetical protein
VESFDLRHWFSCYLLCRFDKFALVLTDNWTRYLAPQINDLTPGSAGTAMHLVGVIEIVAGLAVLVLPRFGAPLVAVWLAGIIVNLLMVGGYGDVALRDFGLMLAARPDPAGLGVPERPPDARS